MLLIGVAKYRVLKGNKFLVNPGGSLGTTTTLGTAFVTLEQNHFQCINVGSYNLRTLV
jgi:hypothetical protein